VSSESLVMNTPIGPLKLVAEDDALVHIGFCDGTLQADDQAAGSGVLREAQRQLQEYFAGTRQVFDLPLKPAGTPFQREVWNVLASIPWGTTRSYGEVARAIGRPRAVRAVGAANGANPLPLLLPCHRVIGSGGTLTGYAGGLDRKRRLLALEGSLPG